MKTINEIERRFLVKTIDRSIKRSPHVRIEQGYFETPPQFEMRVRITDDVKAELTKKTGCGLSRSETTQGISLATGRFLLEACADQFVKTRYKRDGWEIDFFRGPLAGLVLAEFEFHRGDGRPDSLQLPAWLGDDVIEVTESLTNRHVARMARDLTTKNSTRPAFNPLSPTVPRIVLTGGPCSGKSKAMAALRQAYGELVHCVPEVATIVIGQVGVMPPVNDPVGMRQFQRTIYRIQSGFQDISGLQAARDDKMALLLDRGTIDGAAYMDGGLDEFEDICRTDRNHEYGQYDLVICLDTPPRDIFEKMCGNNAARHEDYGQACRLERKIHEVWERHPRFHLVGSGTSWAAKVDKVKRLVRDFLDSRR